MSSVAYEVVSKRDLICLKQICFNLGGVWVVLQNTKLMKIGVSLALIVYYHSDYQRYPKVFQFGTHLTLSLRHERDIIARMRIATATYRVSM